MKDLSGQPSTISAWTRVTLTLLRCVSFVSLMVGAKLNNSLLVINPSVRFSWIEKNWDAKYKKRAVATIKALVSITLI